MSTFFKYNGQFISKDRYLAIKAEERGEKQEEPKEEAQILDSKPIIEESEDNVPVDSIEALRNEYMALSGKGISPKVKNDKQWFINKIKTLKQ